MTAVELRNYFNKEFSKSGVETPWPESFEVDAETYANVCQFIFEAIPIYDDFTIEGFFIKRIALGRKQNGIMFKDVELILKKNKE